MPSPTVVAFAAPSGTGKTTLVCALIEELRSRRFRVGAIKSDAHGVELDTPGKDTHRMRQSGSEATALVSHDQIAIFRDPPGREIPLAGLVDLVFPDFDFVLAEGFRSHGFPTIVVQRGAVDMAGWKWPTHVLAVASDGSHDALPVLPLDDVAGIASFLCRLREGASGSPAEA